MALAEPTGANDPLVRALFLARLQSTMIGMRRIQQRLAAQAPEWADRYGFTAAFSDLLNRPAETQRRVLAHPSAAFWVEVAWDLISRQAHELRPGGHFARHLAKASAFALSACHLVGKGSFVATVRGDSAGRVVFPGAGLCLAPRAAKPYAPITVRVAGDTVELTDASGTPVPYDRLTVACLPETAVEVNWLDQDLRLGGRTRFMYAEPIPPEGVEWVDRLATAWSIVDNVDPVLGAEMRLGVNAIVPLATPDPLKHFSASFREAPGLVALSLGDHLQLTEALVHEYAHQKLYALAQLDPLLAGPTDEALYYSPLRDDPRPLSGLLHAAYTFINILGFYVRAPQLAPVQRLERRTYHIIGYADTLLSELSRHAEFTPIGEALHGALARRLELYRDAVSPPTAEVRTRVDDERRRHRERWENAHGDLVRPHPESAGSMRSPAPDSDRRLRELLDLPPQWSARALRRWYPADMVLDALRALPDPAPVRAAVAGLKPGDSFLADLTAAHLSYLDRDYGDAAKRYLVCLRHEPASSYLWHCHAFALRHCDQFGASLHILTHTAELVTAAQDPAAVAVADDGWPLAEPAPTSPPNPVTMPPSVLESLLESRFWPYVRASSGGPQLPSVMAVAHGLKPAMDVWVRVEGWAIFREMVEALGLSYHIDAYFDRHAPGLDGVPASQLTTTRAGFSRVPRAGTEAHVFLAREPDRLRAAAHSGWYPLLIGGQVVQKHRADHDTFGEALGYPPCCRRFFRERNNWYLDNTYAAALDAAVGTPSVLANPFLRHTVFGLVPHMPCSYTCKTTMAYAGRLRAAIAAELPGYAAEMDRALRCPVLCLSEIRIYRFQGELIDSATVRYRQVQSLYNVVVDDALHELLAAGDRCTVDAGLVHVYRHGRHVGTYEARADRHGPESPFLIAFA
ncbi:HEXXH motif-containing putative peptide modification protein [Sphaerisporangium sp. NPDC051011]|uniref:aKG-HExxH-type peptide beta-hydroxylase n=1 Tax=Sphaerisporangium sp. NPDC051011 TaxID=3155792 RepID=UPI0033D12D3F